MSGGAKFWTYSQNNSGGIFTVDDNVSHYVIIEAADMKQANDRAEEVGLYFGGQGDCPCCGNRWYSEWDEDEGKDQPMIHGEPAKEFRPRILFWETFVTIHYLNGEKERFEIKKEVN